MYPHSTMPAVCFHCGTPFGCRTYRLKLGRPVFCSRTCANRHQGQPLVVRFWRRVKKTDGCWLWTGARGVHGYGTIMEGGLNGGALLLAHRVSWELHNGPIPDGLSVCHNCDKDYPPGDISYRLCVRPDHFFLGTQADNSRDAGLKGRACKGSQKKNAKLTETQVLNMRRAHALGQTKKALSQLHGLSLSTTCRIISQKTWRHVRASSTIDVASLPGNENGTGPR